MTADKLPGWPFEDPPDTAAISLGRIMDGWAETLLVSHDADDGGWKFLDGEEAGLDEAVVVGLGTVVGLDGDFAVFVELEAVASARRAADVPSGSADQGR